MDATLPAVYRTVDAVDNLLLRVSIGRRGGGNAGAGAPGAPAAPAGGSVVGGGAAAAGLLPPPARGPAGDLTVDIAWQQKVYGPR
jgi:hypothetical protein